MLALRLSPETEARLDHVAKVTGRSKHFYAVQAVETLLQSLEAKYLSPEESAEVQALVDFSRIEMALAGELDPDLLTPTEHEHYFDAVADTISTPTTATQRYYAALGARPGAVGTDENDVLVQRQPDGSNKPV
jgi:RHH-type transcriptional regulator, rel operon repressor / antitoxin RelB